MARIIDHCTNSLVPTRNVSAGVIKAIVIFQVIVLLGIWVFSPVSYFPKPDEILSSMGELFRSGLVQDILISFYLNLEAIGVAGLISLLLAYSTTTAFFRPAVNALSKLRFLPMTGLTLVFTMWASSGHELKLSLMVFSVSVFFITSMVDVVNQVPKEEFDLARTLRMNEWEALWEVVVLGQADKAIDSLRQNAAIGWMMLTMIESMVRSEGGVGTVLLDQNHHFHLSAVFAILIILGIIGLLQDYMLGLIKRIVCPYSLLTLERK